MSQTPASPKLTHVGPKVEKRLPFYGLTSVHLHGCFFSTTLQVTWKVQLLASALCHSPSLFPIYCPFEKL